MADKDIQMPTEAMFTFHKMLTFIDRQNTEKLRKDLYYVYYMLRFSPRRAQLADNVVELIKTLKEGRTVKKNLDEYFSKVDAKGPIYVEQENGPDTYIDGVRGDAFAKFNTIRQRVKKFGGL